MNVLAKLKLTDRERSAARETVEQRLRRKLADRLFEQKEVATADLKGEKIVRMTTKLIPNKETGVITRQEVPKRVRRWWWVDADGTVGFKVHYGASPLAISGDKTTVEVKSIDKLPAAIDTIIEAVKAGELDEVLKKGLAERRTKMRRRK